MTAKAAQAVQKQINLLRERYPTFEIGWRVLGGYEPGTGKQSAEVMLVRAQCPAKNCYIGVVSDDVDGALDAVTHDLFVFGS